MGGYLHLPFLLVLLHVGISQVSRCKDQDEACKCDVSATECEFTLKIEELQTFTSYVVSEEDGLLTRGTPGDTYFLDETGYHPAVPDDRSLPERGQCYLSGRLASGEDFVNQSCSIPMTVDGVTYRRYIAVNGRIPGPTLIVTEDQVVKVHVENRLTSEAITIHWHGMHQKKTPWMDGVGFISQSPIAAGSSFDYIFRASPAGTHWYHSHVGAQRTDGLFGALVVLEKDNFFRDTVADLILPSTLHSYQTIYDVPSEHTLTLLDWQREDSLDLFVKIHSTLGFHPYKEIDKVPTNRDSLYNPRTTSQDGIEVGPVPYWSGLINGRGRFNDSIRTPLTIFNITRDSAFRFRVIGAQSLFAYKLSIDEHQLTVIASDGHFIRPVTVDYIIVHSGERYDFLVETTNEMNRNAYFVRAETLEVQFSNHTALAVLQYTNHDLDWMNLYQEVEGSPNRECNNDNSCRFLNCPFNGTFPTTCIHLDTLEALFPVKDADLPKFNTDRDCPDCLQFFNFGFEGDSFTSAVNGKNFQFPVVPYQTTCGQFDNVDNVTNSDVDTCRNCDQSNSDCKCINVVKIASKEKFDYGGKTEPKTVMMVFSAVGDPKTRLNNFSHPIHLHGHSFHVLNIGHGQYDENGRLMTNSEDVTCGNDSFCRNPEWTNGTMPESVIQSAQGTGGRINNTKIRKDTIIVPAGGYVVIAFQADNPGYWFLHCHIEVHQLEGMGVLIEEYPYRNHIKPPRQINQPGNFLWSLDEYLKLLWKCKTCGTVKIAGSIIVSVLLPILFCLLL